MNDRSEDLNRDQSIDAILARVRAEVGDEVVPAAKAPESRRLRQHGSLSPVPMISEPDDRAVVAPGRSFYNIEEFAALDDETFLRDAYRVVLGREMDGGGGGNYLAGLRAGHISVVRVLNALRQSPEGRARGVKIRWLPVAALLDRVAGLPVIGKIAAPCMNFIVRSTTSRRLSAVSVRHNELIAGINTSLSAVRKNQTQLDMRLDVNERNMDDAQRLVRVAVQDASTARDHARKAVAEATEALSQMNVTRQLILADSLKLRALIDAAHGALPEKPAMRESVEALDDHANDKLYVEFENRFRGSTEEISRRLERYLPIFQRTAPVTAGATVLDIGCGRGEWLSLLSRHDIATRGLDLNVAMVAEARALGHDVVEGDAIAYLQSLPDNSLGAITGFHIVEHISFKDLVTLFGEARRVLMPGGVILFETPNPENLVVGACTFNYDPTHNKPLPPDLLRFIAETRDFAETRIIRSDADCLLDQPESGFSPQEINDWFRQPSDYAVYAQKPAGDGQN